MTKEEILKKLEPILVKKENLKVGDKLWSIQLGGCEVTDIDVKDSCPIKIDEDSSYDYNGYFFDEDYFPSLFTQNPLEYLLNLTKQSDLPEYGEEIEVWDTKNNKVNRRKFIGFKNKNTEKRIVCVAFHYEHEFELNMPFGAVCFENYRRITKPAELTDEQKLAELTDEQKLAELVKHFPEIMAIVKK